MRFLTKVATAIALVICVRPATAAGSTSASVLTTPEYQQLQSMFGRLAAIHGTNVRAVKTKESICRHTAGVTVLVRDEKANCLNLIYVGLAAAKLLSVDKRCQSEPTVTKGLNCLAPSYRGFYRTLENEYRSLQRLEQLDKTRGFSAGCVALLGGGPKGVTAYGRIARDAGQVLGDIGSHNTTRLRAAEDRLFAAENGATPTTPARYSLSTCTQAL
jgi:hypothetical protein